jgi:hypothetical protein
VNTNKRSWIAGVLALCGACGDDAPADPCPKLAVGGAVLTPTIATGPAPVATGGALVTGVYHLTKAEVVLREGADTEAVVQCTSFTQVARQETLRFETKTETEGRVVAVARADEPTGIATESAAAGSYVIAASTLTLTLNGTACETTIAPQLDGGSVSTVMELAPNDTPLPRQFSRVEGNVVFAEPIRRTGDSVDCWAVTTYSKQ